MTARQTDGCRRPQTMSGLRSISRYSMESFFTSSVLSHVKIISYSSFRSPAARRSVFRTVAGDEDIRIFIMEETQRAGKIAPLKPFRVSDAECTDHAGRNLLDPVYRLVDPVEDGSGIVQKGASCGVSVIGRLCPVEERDAETVLQGMDLLGDRGLRNIKLIGCFREAAALGGSHEISELVCVHNGNFLSKILYRLKNIHKFHMFDENDR